MSSVYRTSINAIDTLLAQLFGRTDPVNTLAIDNLTNGDGDGPTELPFGLTVGGAPAHVPSGAIMAFGGAAAPDGWLLCDGGAVSQATYAALYAVLGTTYGDPGGGDFNLPDLQQRFPLGKAASGTGDALGATGGAIDHKHSGPSHTHSVPNHKHKWWDEGTGSKGGSYDSGGTLQTWPARTSGTSGVTDSVMRLDGVVPARYTTTDGSSTTGSAGTGDTGPENPPFQVVNYIIKT